MNAALTASAIIPAILFTYAFIERDARAEGGHVAGLALGIGLGLWFLWVTVAVLWVIWR